MTSRATTGSDSATQPSAVGSAPVSAPRPRPHLAGLPAYVPGKPSAPGSFKLSSNENPHPPLPELVAAATDAITAMNRYPDMGAQLMYDAIADHLGVTTDQLASGTGSVAVLYHLLQAFCDPGDEVIYAWRSFEAYPIAAAVTAATSVQVPLTEDGRHDLPAMAAAITEQTKVVLLCSPNNPTGPALTHTEVAEFVAQVPESVLVVLDEAYHEFVRMSDPLRTLELRQLHDNVVVMRTLAKAYGLAGLRVGYLLAHPDVAAAVRACSLPFGVSHVAQVAAVAALNASVALLSQVDAIVAERERVTVALRAQGWRLPEAQGNFVWFPVEDRAAEFGAAAEAAGIVVRPFAGDGVRVSIGEPEANDRLLAVAERWLRTDP